MMLTRRTCAAFICGCGVAAGSHAQPAPEVHVQQLRGELYEVVAGSQATVFLATPDGIIFADPLNRPVARRIREIVESRFPNGNVRYVVYSHHHFDRAEGAAAFGNPQIVAHREFNAALDAARHTVPRHLNIADTNNNGKFDPAEIASSPDAPLVIAKDRNSDGTVTPEELYSQVAYSRVTYTRQRTVMLGGKSVEVIHPGPAYSPDNSILYFPDERVVFAANGPPVNQEPFSFGSFHPRDVDEWIRNITSLDFDTLIFGNGEMMTRARLVALRDDLNAVRVEAMGAYVRGEPLARLQARSAATPDRQRQLTDVYRALHLLRVDVGGGVAGNYERPNGASCSSFASCTAGGAVPAFTGSAALVSGSGAGVLVELTVEQQAWMTRASALYDEEVALRQSRGSVLMRFGPRRDSLFSFAGVGGVSATLVDRRGRASVRGAFVPIGGLHLVHTRDQRLGYTGGMDVAVGRRVAVVIPVRVTFTPSVPRYWPSRLNIHAGVTVSAQVFRRVR